MHLSRAQRQARLCAGETGELLSEDELRFYEAFQASGECFGLIPRSKPVRGTTTGRAPSNDFVWKRPGRSSIEVELKRPMPNALDGDARSLADRVMRLIRRAARSAAEHATPVRKADFIIDLDTRSVPEGFIELLAQYNLRARRREFISPQLDSIHVWSRGHLLEVPLTRE